MAPDAATTTPEPPRKRRWRRRIAWTLGILLLFVLLAPLALGLAPVRNLVAEKIGAALDRRVEIGSASAFWFKGVDLEDVTVHSPEGFDGPLATVARIHADLDVLALIGGTVRARVRVVQPHVTLRRDASGESNTKDLGRRDVEERPAEEPTKLDLELVLVAGTVEALDAGGKAENALRDIQFSASLRPDGAGDIDLAALAEGAGAGGRDARLKLLLTRGADERGVFEVDVPALQLRKLARLAEDTLAVSDLEGTVEARGKGTLEPDDTLTGTLTMRLDGVAARTADGTGLAVRRVLGTATLSSAAGTTEADVRLGLEDVRVQRAVAGRRESFQEPTITLQAVTRHDPADGRVEVAKGSLQGGDLVQVLVKQPLRIEPEAGGRIDGSLEARVSLGRLGALRGLFPALEPLATGTLHASLQGGGAEARDVAVALDVRDLALRPSDLAPDGYAEPRIVADFRVGRTEEGATRIRLSRLGAQIVRLTPKQAGRDVTFTLAEGGAYAVDGDFTLGIGLQSLSRLLRRRLGLERGEELGGALQLVGSGRGTTEEMELRVDVHGTRIVFPPSWGASGTPVALAAKIVSTRKAGESVLTLADLAGMGLGGGGSLRLRDAQADDGSVRPALQQGELDLTVDLARARPWLGGLLGMDRAAELGGRLRADVRIVTEPSGHHLMGTAQANDLLVRARPALAPVREKRVTLRADVHLAEAGGRHEARELQLDAAGLSLDLGGSAYVASPDADADVRAVIGGDAALLAPTLAALLGEGYADLRGKGKLSGTVKLTGSPAHNGRGLLASADLALGSWTSSGLSVESLLARATRADGDAPLSVQVKAGLNGGSALVTGSARLGQETIPWRADVRLAGVDTSGLLVSQGVGRYLTFVLPALLPAGKDTPVLSGRLDAELEGRAPALRGRAMTDGLTGSGRIAMAQGEIKESTLFGGGRSSQLGRAITLLQGLQPEAGAVLAELQKAVQFSSLASEFDVASRVVNVKRTLLTGKRANIHMQGRVLFAGPIDLRSRVVLLGSAGKRLTSVIGQDALPLRVKGTLADPEVKPDVDLSKLVPLPGKGTGGILDDIGKKLPKLPKLPKPPKLPKLPNPFK